MRHPLTAVSTVLTLGLLCGAGNFRKAADRVAELPQALLAAAGVRRHPVPRIRVAPGQDTLRRLVETVDAAVVDRLVCGWLATRLDVAAGCGLALDSETTEVAQIKALLGSVDTTAANKPALLTANTNLTSTVATIATYVRTHWWVENRTHRVRDVLFGEDTHHARIGSVAHAIAALRHLAIALIRLAGHTRIKQAIKRHHADKMLIPTLLNASRPCSN